MTSRTLAWLLAAALAAPVATAGDDKKKEDKGEKPTLELRAMPRFSFSPVVIHLTAELKGGDDIEQYYCPEVEWDWDDGGKSVREGDCDPFETGMEIERRFTETHEYRRAGVYKIKVTLRRTGRAFASASARVTVRPGLGDPSDLE